MLGTVRSTSKWDFHKWDTRGFGYMVVDPYTAPQRTMVSPSFPLGNDPLRINLGQWNVDVS
jgi:hypothetical protein